MPSKNGPQRATRSVTRKRGPSAAKAEGADAAALIPISGAARRAFRVREVAIMLGCDPAAVYKLLHAGKMRYVRLAGGTMLVPSAAIDAFLAGDAA